VLTKIIAVLLLIAMIVSLFTGMYYLVKDRGQSNRTLKALTWRISIWVVLFALLAGAYYFGYLEPSESLRPEWADQQSETGQ